MTAPIIPFPRKLSPVSEVFELLRQRLIDYCESAPLEMMQGILKEATVSFWHAARLNR